MSVSSAIRWTERHDETGRVSPRPRGGRIALHGSAVTMPDLLHRMQHDITYSRASGCLPLSPYPGFHRSAPKAALDEKGYVSKARVEDGRGSLGHSATLRFPSPLIEPDVPD